MPSTPTRPPPPPPTGTTLERSLDDRSHNIPCLQRQSPRTLPPIAITNGKSTTHHNNQNHWNHHCHLHPKRLKTSTPCCYPNTSPNPTPCKPYPIRPCPTPPPHGQIKYSDPILTETQLQSTLQRLLRLKPTPRHSPHLRPPTRTPAANVPNPSRSRPTTANP